VTRSRAAGLVLGAAVVAGLVVAVAFAVGGDAASPRLLEAIRGAGPARAPFRGLTQTRVRVGDRPVRVVVADDVTERSQGLRGREGPDPYAGMLFVFDDAARVGFTMAGVPADLGIAFYDESGRRVDDQLMRSCTGTDATCPVYLSRADFRFALETRPGELPAGRLRAA
jgi:uncharacterized membrane protein (UPF0127 family)